MSALLPAGEAELDALIAEAVQANDIAGFLNVTVAALELGRAVDARHLAGGAMMMQDRHLLGCVAWHMSGELPEPLLHAMQHTILKPDTEAAALFLIAAWCKEHGDRALPAGFITHARIFARAARTRPLSLVFLLALEQLTGDAGLCAVVEGQFAKSEDPKVSSSREQAITAAQNYLRICKQPIKSLMPAAAPKVLAQGFTMRRAVSRIGRNEPCPCRSGKKYKHCCIGKDEERLHFSTDVAGKTIEELQLEPEPHLTLDKLRKADPHEALSWDPRKLKPDLLGEYFIKLGAFHLLERAVEALGLLPWSKSLEESWETIAVSVSAAGRKDLAHKLVALRPDAAAIEPDLSLSLALLLADDDPGKMNRMVDECVMEVLQGGTPGKGMGLAYELLMSRYRGLGIFVARSMIPLLEPKKAAKLFEYLLYARDKLNLPPDDPYGDILEARFRPAGEEEGKEADALREVQARLDAKAKEVEGLKTALDRLHKEIQQREQSPPPVVSVAAPAPTPVEDPALRELRRKVEELRSTLNERHNERNELRRDLQKAHADLELLRQKSPTPAPKAESASGGSEEEEALFHPSEPFIHQPVRIIEFPKGFQAGLASLPKAVARGTLTTLGRLAAGEPAAFVGVVRLKAVHGIYRQRIGSEFRLLFKLLPDRVQVLDLIPRQDLLRRIKTLQ